MYLCIVKKIVVLLILTVLKYLFSNYPHKHISCLQCLKKSFSLSMAFKAFICWKFISNVYNAFNAIKKFVNPNLFHFAVPRLVFSYTLKLLLFNLNFFPANINCHWLLTLKSVFFPVWFYIQSLFEKHIKCLCFFFALTLPIRLKFNLLFVLHGRNARQDSDFLLLL